MSVLFEATQIKGIKLRNRFIRSATWEGMAGEDGSCTPKLTELMRQLAVGEVGLIITSHAYVRPEGQAGPWQLGIYKDELVGGLREMARTVHENGGAVVAQIAHSGHLARPELIGRPALAPSRVEGIVKTPPQEMTVQDIQTVVEAFGHAARRAREAGFDGIQLHVAHGYLMNQFLSPAFNKRKDTYGGPVENRARAPLEALRRVRSEVGRDYPVFVKINCQDFMDGGLTLEDSLAAARMLQDEGIDAVELSGGTLASGDLGPSRGKLGSEEKEAYFRDAAKRYKEGLRIPVILVGGVRSFGLAERLVKEGYADYISMSRPFIREPGLVKRWRAGDRAKATCVSDNQCFIPARAGEGISCVVEKKLREKS